MMSRTHMAIGAAAGAAASLALRMGPAESIGLAVVAALGATLPDIDTEQSTASRTLFKAVPILAAAYILAGLAAHLMGWSQSYPPFLRVGLIAAAVMLIPTATRVIFGHRGATHSVLVWTAMLLALYVTGYRGTAVILAGSVCVGVCVGGILPDAITPAGVPLLWPVTDRKFHLLPDGLRIRTGGWIERLLVRPLAYLAILAISLRIAGLI